MERLTPTKPRSGIRQFGGKQSHRAPLGWIEDRLMASNLAIIDDLFAPNYTNHNSRLGVLSREYTVQETVEFLTDFSDWETPIHGVIAEGEKVVVPGAVRGTYKGEVQGASVPLIGKLNGGSSTIPGSSSAKFDPPTIVAVRVPALIHHIHAGNHRPNGSETWN